MNMDNEIILNIDGKNIGGNNPTYVIAEGGLNHNGHLKTAKKIIEQAHESGADAIKFQTYKSEKFLSTKSQYFNFFKDVELSYDEFAEINDYAKTVGITFFSAPFDIESAIELKKLKVPCIKIASSDITNTPLLKSIAQMKLPMIISTGLSTLSEVEEATKTCISENNRQLMLLHCIADYPTRPKDANLLAIHTMKKKFNYPIGYSDNGESTLVDIVAVSMGAKIIEKHFTLDKKMVGPDHSFSIDPIGLTKLISEIRIIEEIKGDGEKIPQPSEINNIQEIRKSIMASTEIEKGVVFTQENLAIKRPATGLEPNQLEKILGKRASKRISKDSPIDISDII
jgi:N,N'-diacetyllegionaminate synthase